MPNQGTVYQLGDVIPHGITPELLTAAYPEIDPATPGLESLIDSAVDAIRLVAGWHVFPIVDMHAVLDGPGGNLLSLPTANLHAVTRLVVDGRELVRNDERRDFRVSRKGLVSVSSFRCGFPDELESIEIDFRHGLTALPANLYGILGALVERGSNRASIGNRVSMTVGQRSETYANDGGNFGLTVPFAYEEKAIREAVGLGTDSGFGA